MKYLSVLIFTGALIWSWNQIHGTPKISFETHAGIQEKLMELIVQTIKNKKPEATNVQIEKIWTEILEPNRVNAHFAYSYVENSGEGVVTSKITGQGQLERQPDDGSGLDHWVLSQVKTSSDAIVFEDGLIVTPDGQGSTESAPEKTESPATESQ